MFYLAFVVVLGVLIFVHELGHFWAAKAVGIGVPRFSIGLGPATPFRFRRGETEYVISWVPFGGYVKMASQEELNELKALEGGDVESPFPPEKLFENKRLAARIFVISAGVVMNAVFAWLAYSWLAFAHGLAMDTARIARVEAGQPAELAGLEAGDLIVAIDGAEVRSWSEMTRIVEVSAGKAIELTVVRGEETLEIPITPAEESAEDPKTGEAVKVGRLGIRGSQLDLNRARYSPSQALVEGARLTAWAGGQVLGAVKGMILGRVSVREIGGPVAIAQASAEAAREGPEILLLLMAFLSINLAILNLLPIPALDGGHLVFLALEGLRGGRPVSNVWRGRLTMAGVYFLVALMVLVVINDLMR